MRDREVPLGSAIPAAARAWHSIDQSATNKRAAQVWLDLCSDCVVRVTDPRHVGRDVERRRKRPTALVGHTHTKLARDELRAEIVRMTAKRRATGAPLLDERPQIGDEAIVSREEFVELAAAGDVLILERLRFARLWSANRRFHHFVVEGAKLRTMSWKKSRHRSEPLCHGRGR